MATYVFYMLKMIHRWHRQLTLIIAKACRLWNADLWKLTKQCLKAISAQIFYDKFSIGIICSSSALCARCDASCRGSFATITAAVQYISWLPAEPNLCITPARFVLFYIFSHKQFGQHSYFCAHPILAAPLFPLLSFLSLILPYVSTVSYPVGGAFSLRLKKYFTVVLFLSPHSPDAWTSVTYCSSSCPWWMTSKVRLFIVSALSAWCCNLCSASVRSSVSKSLICWDSSSFHDSRSEMIWWRRRGQREWDRKTG